MLITYLRVFVVGGSICLIGQVLINTTKLTAAKILVIFLLSGVVLEVLGIYQHIIDFGHAGATVPIVGFGSLLAKGAMSAASERGILGAIAGGLETVSVCLSAVMVAGLLSGLIISSRTKK
ncbi:MAG: SpoVA/SpoVAEb family sporulation membrane protein [Christensenellaceae bacterium]|jgi:stage V sporulation protein AE|nr:SpoVA/SpoVAEb family sporulation membrane protein [Christensenellaceae bacterium]